MTYLGLQKLKHKLDECWKAREAISRGFKAIKRVESTISALPPPVNPVKWAVSMTSNSSEAVLVDYLDETSMATYETFLLICICAVESPSSKQLCTKLVLKCSDK